MLCKKCGASVPDNSYECPFCGAKLSDIEVAEKKNIAPDIDKETIDDTEAVDNEEIFDENEIKRREQVKRMMAEKQQQLSEIQERREQKRKKEKRNKAILVALICALSAGVVCGASYLINNYRNKPVVPQVSSSPEVTVDPSALPTVDPSMQPLPTLLPTTLPLTTEQPGWTAVSGDTSSSGNSGTSLSNGNASSGARSSSSGSSSSGGGSSRGNSSSGGSSSSGNSSSSSSSSTRNSSSGGFSSGGSSSSSSNSSSSGNSTRITNTGIVNSGINAILAKGGEVIYDNSTGRYIMTFISSNKEYYAYVSAGSTTDQIYGKNMTITALPTASTYRGSTIFDIKTLTTYEGDYIIKDSGTRLLTDADIAGMSKDKLALARNEIFARHGRPFTMQVYKEYFESRSWYKVNPNYNLKDDGSNLNEVEMKNVDFIFAKENNM